MTQNIYIGHREDILDTEKTYLTQEGNIRHREDILERDKTYWGQRKTNWAQKRPS